MIIREASREDSKEIANNNVQLAEETEGRIISKNLAELGSSSVLSGERGGWYLVAEHNNKIIGQVFITEEWSDWRNKAIWWMHRVYVKESWRKKGVFTALLQELKQMAIDEQVFALRLYQVDTNKKAARIYNNMGFADTSFRILEKRCNRS
jgi:GNAT superfamily N-acetyltransferase